MPTIVGGGDRRGLNVTDLAELAMQSVAKFLTGIFGLGGAVLVPVLDECFRIAGA
jgi:hypothetical protein